MAHADHVLYAYGVVYATQEIRQERLVHDEIALVVSRVDRTAWSEDALRENLNNLEWLSAAALAHESVLDSLMPGPLVPFPLGTIFSDRESAMQMLRERGDELAQELDKLQGRVEIGVVVHLDPAIEPVTSQEHTASGVGYLKRRIEERETQAESRQSAREVGEHIHEQLISLAEQAHLNPPRSKALDRRSGWNVLNAAYLIDSEAQDRFAALASGLHEEYAARGVTIDLTGPWPPFHFTGAGR
jgi:hypothetical protein